jgi:hypothetical protein
MRASAPARRKVPDLVALKKEMTDKGVLLTSAELTPSSHGKRTTWRAGSRKITDGPFAESKEFIGATALSISRRWYAEILLTVTDTLEIDIRPFANSST